MDEIGFYRLTKKYNNHPQYQTESGDGYVTAIIYSTDENGNHIDTTLYNDGNGWMD